MSKTYSFGCLIAHAACETCLQMQLVCVRHWGKKAGAWGHLLNSPKPYFLPMENNSSSHLWPLVWEIYVFKCVSFRLKRWLSQWSACFTNMRTWMRTLHNPWRGKGQAGWLVLGILVSERQGSLALGGQGAQLTWLVHHPVSKIHRWTRSEEQHFVVVIWCLWTLTHTWMCVYMHICVSPNTWVYTCILTMGLSWVQGLWTECVPHAL